MIWKKSPVGIHLRRSIPEPTEDQSYRVLLNVTQKRTAGIVLSSTFTVEARQLFVINLLWCSLLLLLIQCHYSPTWHRVVRQGPAELISVTKYPNEQESLDKIH